MKNVLPIDAIKQYYYYTNLNFKQNLKKKTNN